MVSIISTVPAGKTSNRFWSTSSVLSGVKGTMLSSKIMAGKNARNSRKLMAAARVVTPPWNKPSAKN